MGLVDQDGRPVSLFAFCRTEACERTGIGIRLEPHRVDTALTLGHLERTLHCDICRAKGVRLKLVRS